MINNAADYGLEDDLVSLIKQSAISSIMHVRNRYDDYLADPQFRSWDDVTTGEDETIPTFMTIAYKFFEHAENSGQGYKEPLKRMMAVLQQFDESLATQYLPGGDDERADAFRSTLMITAMSYGFDTDLRDEFQNELDFPLDNNVWDELLGDSPDECADATYEAEDMVHSAGGSHPDGWNLWSNGYAAFTHSFEGGTQEMVVSAAGEWGAGWPNMVVKVDGSPVYSTTVDATEWTDYTFAFQAPAGTTEVRVYFTNDYYYPPIDRNLLLDKVTVICSGDDLLEADLNIFTDWGTGYCADLLLTNNGDAPTTDWTVVLDTDDTDLYQYWNAQPISGTGTHIVSPIGWNNVINPGSTINAMGFCAGRTGSPSTMPAVVSAEGYF
jgi:hypothetical protein